MKTISLKWTYHNLECNMSKSSIKQTYETQKEWQEWARAKKLLKPLKRKKTATPRYIAEN